MSPKIISGGGCCVWLTGLSSAGKTTIARVLSSSLDHLERPNCVLDGDYLQRILWPELKGGTARQDRCKKSLRLAFSASLVVRFGGFAICAIISPYLDERLAARRLISEYGIFFEVLINTPLALCEERDRRDFYRRARRGEIANFTGISEPYEPSEPDLVIGNSGEVEDAVAEILSFLRQKDCL